MPNGLLTGRSQVGDRVFFQTEQMGGAGFLVAILEHPADPGSSMASVAVLDYPSLLTIPIANVQTIEAGVLQRNVIISAPQLKQ